MLELFLRFDKVFGNPYDQYYTWNGFDLEYEPMNPTAINFESEVCAIFKYYGYS